MRRSRHPSEGPPALDARNEADLDGLTGLASRTHLVEAAEAAARDAEATGRPIALLFIGLNGFKRVNDSLGHGVGDQLLKQVADRLKASVRAGELLARFGGDEFILLVRDLVPEDVEPTSEGAWTRAQAIGHRLTAVLDAPFSLQGIELLVEAGVGASILPLDADTVEMLRRHADAAMYQAKAEGSQVVVYGADTPDPLERWELAAHLRRAVDREELELHYQPVVALPEAAVVGIEALVRWRDPERGLIPPDEFIPIAESTGVIGPLGDWVLEALCVQAAEWSREGLLPNLGYNVSPRQLQQADFPERVLARVHEHGIDPHRMVLELTESAWSLQASRLLPTLQALRAGGLALAIDDFGAGYSSLWRLRELPVQVIKIDRALLRGVPHQVQATAVVSAIMALARACGCDVVAEGVETAEQQQLLVSEGCQLAQGFHFGRPLPSAGATAVLRDALIGGRRSRSF